MRKMRKGWHIVIFLVMLMMNGCGRCWDFVGHYHGTLEIYETERLAWPFLEVFSDRWGYRAIPRDSIVSRFERFHEMYPGYEIPSEGKWGELAEKVKKYKKSYCFYIKKLDMVLNASVGRPIPGDLGRDIHLNHVYKFAIPRGGGIMKRYERHYKQPSIFYICDLGYTELETIKEVFEEEILSKIYKDLEYINLDELRKRENLKEGNSR